MTQASSSSVFWAHRGIASVPPKIPPTVSTDCWAWAWMSELLLHSPAAGLPGCSFPQPVSSAHRLCDHSHHLYKLPPAHNTCAQHSHHSAENNHPHSKAAGDLGSPAFKGKIGFFFSELKQAEFNPVHQAKRNPCTSLHKWKRDQDFPLLKYHHTL